MDDVAEYLAQYLRDIMYEPARATMNIEELPEDYREVGRGLKFFADCVSETRSFAKFLARGELNCPMPSMENELAAPLKSLHATLKHLTWQTQQVARGDYRQYVDYLGDFAEAFNTISQQLDRRSSALMQEIERSRRYSRSTEQSNELFEAIVRDSSRWVVVTDKTTGEWLYTNSPVMHLLADEDFVPQLKRWITAKLAELEHDVTSQTVDLELSNNGIAQSFSVLVHPIIWRERPAAAFVFSDISVERNYARDIENTAYRDTLTRQYNRHYGLRLLEQWVAERRQFMISFVDIDNLKYVNDKFGQTEGDKYILSVTAVLRGFSPEITICRLGGDEFMLLAEGWDEERSMEHLESLRNRLMKKNRDSDSLYLHCMSYGVVVVERDNMRSPSEIMAQVDEKMYEYRRLHKLETIINPDDMEV